VTVKMLNNYCFFTLLLDPMVDLAGHVKINFNSNKDWVYNILFATMG
jgi:hypothetical protein